MSATFCNYLSHRNIFWKLQQIVRAAIVIAKSDKRATCSRWQTHVMF
jgi:hypothetical protein